MHVEQPQEDLIDCKQCGQPFAPKVAWQGFCTDICRNSYHNKKDKDPAVSGTRRQYKEMADGTLRVQVDIDPIYKQEFLRLFPEIDYPVCLVPLAPDFESKAPKKDVGPKPYGEQAKTLYQSSFLRSPDVWAVLGTDDDYRAWVQKQPSAYSQEFSEFVNGEGRCVAAHVRRIATGSGVGIKNDYSVIPLTDKEHSQMQHQSGESALGGKDWFDSQRIKYVRMWAWTRLREIMQHESMGDCPPSEVYKWALAHGVDKYLPKSFSSCL